jgi:hypothetical protein
MEFASSARKETLAGWRLRAFGVSRSLRADTKSIASG